MNAATEPTRAKRGDLVIVAREYRDYIIGQPSREYTTCEVGTVTSITRDGVVKAFRSVHYYGQDGCEESTQLSYLPKPFEALIVPAAKIDVQAALKTAYEHCWPSGHPCMPYGSLAEVREALRPHLLVSTDAAGEGIK